MKRWETINRATSQKLKVKSEDIIQILLENRGIRDKNEIEEFLNPSLENVTANSVGLDEKQIKKALNRIETAIQDGKTIIIYGDYDVDGICGTAILWESLYSQYKKAIPYIPHRADEGYGLSHAGIDSILEKYPDTDLIITVDNGIVAYDAVDYAHSRGIDVIVTDHHVKGEKDINAYAVIHSTKVCGAAVGYLFAKEYLKDLPDGKFLDLVTLATVADLVPLIGPSRSLVFHGIPYLQTTSRYGLQELYREAGIDQSSIGVYQIGHVIAPRINATGRLSSALDSLRLVCTKDIHRARMLARVLGDSNKERQDLTKALAEHAVTLCETRIEQTNVLVVAHETYNQGVIGLIASKLVEQYYKPALVISIGEQLSKGSARSVKGVNIIDMIRSVSGHLVQAGGHPMAAGFTVETKKIEIFKKALEDKAMDIVSAEHLQRVINIDLELPWDMITSQMYKKIQKLAPFGIGNPEPVFMTKNVYINDVRTIGRDNSHYKLVLEQNGAVHEAVAFNFVKSHDLKVGDKIDALYCIDFDTWRGKNKVKLMIRDIRLSDL